VVVSLPPSTYRVTVTLQGFKTATVQNIKLNAGAPATVNVALELGAVADTVEVTSGAEVLQTTTSSVTTTLTGRQITHLPLVTRNALDLIVIQPGAQSPGTSRTTSINGLPKGQRESDHRRNQHSGQPAQVERRILYRGPAKAGRDRRSESHHCRRGGGSAG
jgi:hypothetical protein